MKVVFARETAVVGHITVVAGSYWLPDDPIVVAHPSLFTDEPVGLSYSRRPEPAVEQATRAPGEKRTTRRAQ